MTLFVYRALACIVKLVPACSIIPVPANQNQPLCMALLNELVFLTTQIRIRIDIAPVSLVDK